MGGAPDTTIAPGVSGHGDKTAIPGGYNANFTASSPGPEFGKEPPQAQASADGDVRRDKDHKDPRH